jgi:hypothetical protein
MLFGLCVFLACRLAVGEERTEHFDNDPQWEGYNHRAAAAVAPLKIRQDFGFRRTAHAGGRSGEIGGFVSPAGEAAYYATKIPTATFDDSLLASGTLACSGEPFHVLLGFFNADTVNEWRTPNTIALRLMGRGEVFFAFLEYATAKWRAGGDSPQSFPTHAGAHTSRMELKGFPINKPLRFSLRYDPKANDGKGAVTATIDGQTAICNLDAGHKQDAASFNRFGLLTVMKSADTGGQLWLDDVEVGGRTFDFALDPQWEARNNRRSYETSLVRPRYDFGFSPTQHAGGSAGGELGGVIFRGDCRYPDKMAHYADRLDSLSLDRPLKASGKVCLKRAVSDSGVLIGFFDARESTQSNPSQDSGLPKNFFGISTDAPSRDGFYFSPTYRVAGDHRGYVQDGSSPALYPDSKPRDWTFDYSPTAAGGNGQITVTIDGHSVRLPLDPGARAAGTRFDRFGIISTWVDGNSQTIFFDDLTYTVRQD